MITYNFTTLEGSRGAGYGHYDYQTPCICEGGIGVLISNWMFFSNKIITLMILSVDINFESSKKVHQPKIRPPYSYH